MIKMHPQPRNPAHQANSSPVIKIIVGLGNKGAKYQQQRHNIGFQLVDAIQQQGNFSNWTPMLNQSALVSKGEWLGGNWGSGAHLGDNHGHPKQSPNQLILLKPMTYMNLSGQAVQGFLTKERLPLPDILPHIMVLHDDIDLDFLRIKIKWGGGDGGHNGLRDLTARLGNGYGRVRIGVGHPHRQKGMDNGMGNGMAMGGRAPADSNQLSVSDYVLSDFTKTEQSAISQFIPKFLTNCQHLITGRLQQALIGLNRI